MVTLGLMLESLESRMSPKPEAARLFLPRDPSENMTLQVSVSLSLWKQRHFSGLSYEVLAGVTSEICPILQSAFVITKTHNSCYLSTFTVSVHWACSLSHGSTRIQSDVCRASRAMATR